MSPSTTPVIDTTGNDSYIFDMEITFLCTIIPLSLAGNSLVCIAFCTDKKLKQVPGNFLMVSLAAADILLTLVVMIGSLITAINNDKWIFGAEFCTIFICIDITCATASILNLCAISIDRYIRIKHALYYDLMMTEETIGFIIFLVWAISGLLSFGPVYLGWHKVPNQIPLPDDVCIFKTDFTYALISSCISFYIPSIIIIVIYYKIFVIARSHDDHIESHISSINNQPKRKKTIFESKSTFTLGITTGVFIVCWLPFFICNVLSRWSPDMVSRHFFIFSLYAGYSNSCFNPIIYSVFNQQYRRTFKRILRCKKHNRDCISSSLQISKRPSLRKQQQEMKRRSSEHCCPPVQALEIHKTENNELQTKDNSNVACRESCSTMNSNSDIFICSKNLGDTKNSLGRCSFYRAPYTQAPVQTSMSLQSI